MGATSIEWTDRSINPFRARKVSTGAVGHYCELVSAGCAHCYASALQKRFMMPPYGSKMRDDIEVFFDDAKLLEVIRRKKPTKFFWCDMTDMFGEWVPDEWIDKCFAAMALTPHHTHQVLTKRADRMAEYFRGDVATRVYRQVSEWLDEGAAGILGRCWDSVAILTRTDTAGGPRFHNVFWALPLDNVWLGVSVENQATADERIPHLLNTPAVVRFLSAEPLLGPIDLEQCGALPEGSATCHYGESHRAGRCSCNPGVSWVIVGGESGGKARPCASKSIASVAAQCVRAGVPVFVKQMGSNAQTSYYDNLWRDFYESHGWEWPDPIGWNCLRDGQPMLDAKVRLRFNDRKGGDPAEWPEDLRVRQFPVAASMADAEAAR